MLAQMPNGLFSEWIAYDRLEPIDHAWRNEVEFGKLTTFFANLHRDRKKRQTPYKLDDFMTRWGAEPKKPKTADEIYQQFRNWALMMGAKKAAK